MSRESDIFTAGRYLDGDLTTFPELPLTRLPRRRLHCTAVTEGGGETRGQRRGGGGGAALFACGTAEKGAALNEF